MTEEQTTSHLVSYPDIKEPQKPLTEKHASPRKAAVLNFNPDGSLCIPADLKEKLVHQPTKINPPNRPTTGSKENVTPDSRKRKKNNGPAGAVWVPPPQGCCHFCYTKDVTKKLGVLKEIDGILAHHSCLLFSSGLCQAGNNEEGLWGFLTPNIKKELSRGKRLKCSFCRLPGALVGCHKARCSYTYHLTCGLSNGCLMQYYDNFRSFCDSHRPRQNYLEEMMGKTVECAICGDMIPVESKVVPQHILVTECCNMTPLHRECIQNQADASGYFFRCPMCNNEKKFNNIMKIMGINIPQSDAVWEKDGYYDDLYVEHWRCDVPICLHPDGRKGDSRNNDKWDLMKCCTCGQAGAHPYCLGYEKRGPKDWSCATCVTIETKYETERLEEDKKRAEAAASSQNTTPDQETAGPSNLNTSAGTSRSRNPSSSSSKRPRKKTLSPSKDPFLMTPETLKEAVFKLCVAKMKKDKLIEKNLNPDIWIGLDSITSDASDPDCSTESDDTPSLVARPINLCLTKVKYTPPPDPTAIVVENEEVEEYNEHKEKLWELIVKHRRDKAFIRKVTKTSRNLRTSTRGKQTTINSFFKLTTLNKRNDRDNYTARAKRRKIETSEETNTKKSKVKQENEYEPFPFKRSPHQSPYPSRDRTPDSFPLSTSPPEPSKQTAENIPEPVPPKPVPPKPVPTKTVPPKPVPPKTVPPKQSMKSSPKKEEQESEGTPEKIQQTSSSKVNISPSTYKCYYCEDKFSKMSIRMDHMRNVHSNRIKGWDGTKAGRLRGKRRSLSSEKPDIAAEVKDIKNNEDDEVEVVFTEGPSPAKKTTSLRRTPRKTSSAVSFTPIKMRKSSSSVPLIPRKTKKSSPDVTVIKEEPKTVPAKPKGRRKRKRRFGKKKKKAPKCEDEVAKYGELTIEVAEKKEDTEESEEDEVEFVETIFTEPPEPEEKEKEKKKKRRKKKSYDWSENEVFSLIEYYSSNPYLWDDSCKYESNEEELLQRLERKLDIPADRIISKWKSLVSRYKVEKYNPGSDWRFLSALNFLEEANVTSCPEDVSPLFSLLTGADSQQEGDSDESEEHDNSLDDSQDIFPNLSDNDVIEDDDSESKSSDTVVSSEEQSTNTALFAEDPTPSSALFPEEQSTEPLTITNSFKSRTVPSTTVQCYDEEMLSPVKSIPAKNPSPSGESSNLCEECGRSFPSRGKLMQHKLKLRYFCCHCLKNFASVASLKQHQDCLDMMLHICPFCHMFRNEESKHTVRHISENHVKQWIATECLKCKALFKNKEKALAHLRHRHAVPAVDGEDCIRVRDFRCLYDKDC